MRELAEDEIASISGGEGEATVEPAPEPGLVGSFLRWVNSFMPAPTSVPAALDGGGIRG